RATQIVFTALRTRHSSCKLLALGKPLGSKRLGNVSRSDALNRSARCGAVVISAVGSGPRRPIAEARLPSVAGACRQPGLAWSRSGHLDPCSPWRSNLQTHGERKSSQTRSRNLPGGSVPGRRLERGTLRLEPRAGVPTLARW